MSCDSIFTTSEKVDLSKALIVTTGSGKINSFDDQILFISIYESLKHRNSAFFEAKEITATVIGKIISIVNSPKLSTSDIKRIAYSTLKTFDNDSATIYAAYHS